MRGARAMGFNTTFRTTHGRCRFRGVQFLPVTQQERFALTRRELAQRFFNHRDQLGLSQMFLNSLRLTWQMSLWADSAILLRTMAWLDLPTETALLAGLHPRQLELGLPPEK